VIEPRPRERLVWAMAAAYIVIQLALSHRYGYFRDEFYYLACGEHLAWGYVDHPPLIAVIAKISRAIFGESLLAIRLLSALAGGATILMTAGLVRIFGGDTWSQALAALAVAIAPVFLFLFHILSMNAWDILLWTAAALVCARIVVENRPALWPLLGAIVGVGLLNKHSMAFFVASLGVGLLLTPSRRWLFDRRVWIAAAIATFIAAPHVWWQVSNGWPTLEFIRNAQAMKNAQLSPMQFVAGQLLDIHPLNFGVLIAGLIFLLTADHGRYRMFGIAYVVLFAILVRQGKPYYMSPIYPLMLAAGSAAIGRATGGGRRWIRPVVAGTLAVSGLLLSPFVLPILPVERFIAYQRVLHIDGVPTERHQLAALPQHYADMFGWDDIVETVARVYRSLPADERAKVGIFALNYGDAGAIDLLGPRHGLPKRAISPHNNYFLWGPGDASGDVLIVVGGNVEDHRQSYADVRRVDTIECGYCMPYENHRPVYVLRRPIRSMQEIWRTSKMFI